MKVSARTWDFLDAPGILRTVSDGFSLSSTLTIEFEPRLGTDQIIADLPEERREKHQTADPVTVSISTLCHRPPWLKSDGASAGPKWDWPLRLDPGIGKSISQPLLRKVGQFVTVEMETSV